VPAELLRVHDIRIADDSPTGEHTDDPTDEDGEDEGSFSQTDADRSYGSLADSISSGTPQSATHDSPTLSFALPGASAQTDEPVASPARHSMQRAESYNPQAVSSLWEHESGPDETAINSTSVADQMPDIPLGLATRFDSDVSSATETTDTSLGLATSLDGDASNATQFPYLPDDCYSNPPVAELRRLSSANKSSVEGFMIGRKGFGEIAFKSPTNVSQIDLRGSGKLLWEGERGACCGVELAEGAAPELSKQASITLEFESGFDYEELRQDLNSQDGMTFVDYSPGSGRLQFVIEKL
jgi:hypothetical protein